MIQLRHRRYMLEKNTPNAQTTAREQVSMKIVHSGLSGHAGDG
jgi:hypothetical protein